MIYTSKSDTSNYTDFVSRCADLLFRIAALFCTKKRPSKVCRLWQFRPASTKIYFKVCLRGGFQKLLYGYHTKQGRFRCIS